MFGQRPEPKVEWDGTVRFRNRRAEINIYGPERERSGVAMLVMEPNVESVEARIGAEVTFRVVEIHREVVEK